MRWHHVALTSIILTTTAYAQIAITPSPPNLPVCIDRADAYKLALADMKGTLSKLWNQFVGEGRCAYLPAKYLFTIDTYMASEPSRVVEMLAYGERVWGLRGNDPIAGIWPIVWDGVRTANSTWYEEAEMTDAARKRFGYSWNKCCAQAEVFRTQFHVNKDNGDDEWWYQLPNGSWKLIPSDIVHWGESAPDKRPTLFIYQGIEVCFWPGEGGI